MKVLVLMMLITSACSHIQKSQNSCSKLNECLELASNLTSKKYLYQNLNLDVSVKSVGTVEWTKTNADELLGDMLNEAGLTRLPTTDENVYTLINARDIRYASNVKSYKATLSENDPMPTPTAGEFVELVYQSKNPMRAAEIARNLRPFVSRYGRVIDVTASQLIIVRDHLKNSYALLSLIRKMDVPMTKEEQEHQKKWQKEMHEKIRKAPK